MLVLYRAAAETFRDLSFGQPPDEGLSPGGRVINRDRAEQVLQSLPDHQLAALATRFANRVIDLSEGAGAAQDLHDFVALFLHAVRDQGAREGIVSGSISRHSKRLADPDFW
jgi:hypothetical protein